MPRSKSIGSRRHRKVLKQAKGYKHAAGKRIKAAKEAVLHAGQYAYVGRKLKKRNLRALWIIRIGAATKSHEMSYSKFIAGLKQANIQLDRKILSDMAIHDKPTFEKIVELAKTSK